MTRVTTITDESANWSFYALCRGKEHLFDSREDYTGRDYYPFEDEAKVLCDVCSVFNDCDREAIKNKEPQGIWAGKVRRGK